MKNWLSHNWLTLFCMFAPLAVGFAWYDQLPEEIPSHWNLKGEVDDTMPKFWALVAMPIVMLFVNGLFWALPILDPSKKVEQSMKFIRIAQLITNLFTMVIELAIVGAALGYQFDVAAVICYGVLLMFLVLGNYMGKVRPNQFVGIRTPWTLGNDEVWRKTHKLTAWVWVATSLALIGFRFISNNQVFFLVFIPVILLMTFVPILYSYIIYPKARS